MKTGYVLVMCVAAGIFSGCADTQPGKTDAALLTSIGSVSIYRYHASQPVKSHKTEIDGKEYESHLGPMSQDLELAIIECEKETRFHLRFGTGVTTFSVPKWEAGAKSGSVTIPNHRLLNVNGPTQIYQMVEKSMDNPGNTRQVRILVE